MKKVLGFIFAILFMLIIVALLMISSENEKNAYSSFKNDELKNNISIAFKNTDMTTDKIKTIEKIDDWNNGPRYKINYDGKELFIYAYDNNTIASIRDSNLNFLYQDETASNSNSSSNGNELVLKYGDLGEYGKYDIFDGEKYIRYYLPTGTYEAKALVRNSKFYVVSQEIVKNSSGYDEDVTIDTITLFDAGTTQTFKVEENQCISLVMNTQIAITKK